MSEIKTKSKYWHYNWTKYVTPDKKSLPIIRTIDHETNLLRRQNTEDANAYCSHETVAKIYQFVRKKSNFDLINLKTMF